jgi:hypothetical protein
MAAGSADRVEMLVTSRRRTKQSRTGQALIPRSDAGGHRPHPTGTVPGDGLGGPLSSSRGWRAGTLVIESPLQFGDDREVGNGIDQEAPTTSNARSCTEHSGLD